MEFEGGCHCGNLELKVHLTKSPTEVQVRADQCSFCRAHGAHSISDPEGLVRISAREPSKVSRYRFALRTADFLICARCGVYVGAVCTTPSGLRAVVNVNALKDRSMFTQAVQPVDYSGESAQSRISRREARWMPAETSF